VYRTRNGKQLGNDREKRKDLRRFRKTVSVGAEVTSGYCSMFLLRPHERWRSIVMSTSVCLSVYVYVWLSVREHIPWTTRDLYQVFVLVAQPITVIRSYSSEIVRYLPHKKKQNFGCLSNCFYCAVCAKNLSDQPPTFGLQHSKFYPNRFTFGESEVIAERVKAVLFAHRVFPIFARRPSGE